MTTKEEKEMVIQWTKNARLMNYAYSKGLRAEQTPAGYVAVWSKPRNCWVFVNNYADVDEVVK